VTTSRRNLLFAFTGIMLAPLVWAICFQFNYAAVSAVCKGGGAWRLHAIWLVAMGSSIGGGWTAYLLWAANASQSTDEASVEQRNAFLGIFGMLLSGTMLLLITAQWIPVFLIDPCAR
jgi:hypothetical protein